MAWPNSQLECSSARPACALLAPTQPGMSLLEDAVPAAAAATEEPASQRASDDSDSGGEPAATEALPPAGGTSSAGAEAPPIAALTGCPGSSGDARPALFPNVQGKEKNILTEIQALKAEQKRARDAKKQITKELRNAEKRRQRLKKRAKQLSDNDLLAVMTLRSAEQGLRKRDAGEPTASAGAAEHSDSGTVTPTSTTRASTPTSSPKQQPASRARTS